MGKARKAPCPTEHEEQAMLFQWAYLHQHRYPDLAWLYAIPNAGGYSGGFKSNVVRVKRMLAEGVRPGYPDIGLDVARGGYYGLRIEMKRIKGGRIEPEQVKWIARLEDQGYCCSIATGWRAGAVTLQSYLEQPATWERPAWTHGGNRAALPCFKYHNRRVHWPLARCPSLGGDGPSSFAVRCDAPGS